MPVRLSELAVPDRDAEEQDGERENVEQLREPRDWVCEKVGLIRTEKVCVCVGVAVGEGIPV